MGTPVQRVGVVRPAADHPTSLLQAEMGASLGAAGCWGPLLIGSLPLAHPPSFLSFSATLSYPYWGEGPPLSKTKKAAYKRDQLNRLPAH